MLDSLKGFGGGGKTQKQVDDLQGLITAAKEERSALSAMLTQISMRSSKLSQMGKSLEQGTSSPPPRSHGSMTCPSGWKASRIVPKRLARSKSACSR